MTGRREPPAPKKPHAPLNMIPVYRTLQELKAASPSRAHGLSEEDEESWKRAAVNLMVSAGLHMGMDHSAVVMGLEFFHRFYAEYSMVTNDRFLMSMACMYLGGKIADTPKASRDIIHKCVEHMCATPEEAFRLLHDIEWMKQTRKAINDAERALLYQLGFRFSWMSALSHVIRILNDRTTAGGIGTFLNAYYEAQLGSEDNPYNQLSQIAVVFALESAKVPLALQYPTDAIAAVCIFMGMKFMKVNAVPPALVEPETRQAKQWYYAYGLENKDVDIIADQITGSVVADAKAAEDIMNRAVEIKVEILGPDSNQGGKGAMPPPPPPAVGVVGHGGGVRK